MKSRRLAEALLKNFFQTSSRKNKWLFAYAALLKIA